MARRAKSLWSREARLAGAAGHMKGRAWSQPLRALLDLLRADLFSEPQAPSTVAGSQGVGQKGLKGALPWGGVQLKPQVHSPQLPIQLMPGYPSLATWPLSPNTQPPGGQ